MVHRDRWDTYWGPKKLIFLIRDTDDATMTAAPVESCQSVAPRSPGARFMMVLDVGRRLHACADSWGSPESSGSKTWGTWALARCLAERIASYVSTDGSFRACGVGACPRLIPTQNDFRETSGPRIDRIPPTRPPWRRRRFRELKKLIFSAPSKCPIDLFEPLANGTILKRLHVVLLASVLRPLARNWGN